jgi:hypothetical protein
VGLALGAAALGVISAAGLLAATYRPDQQAPSSDTESPDSENEDIAQTESQIS